MQFNPWSPGMARAVLKLAIHISVISGRKELLGSFKTQLSACLEGGRIEEEKSRLLQALNS